jgi:ADP-ribose diphosphatase
VRVLLRTLRPTKLIMHKSFAPPSPTVGAEATRDFRKAPNHGFQSKLPAHATRPGEQGNSRRRSDCHSRIRLVTKVTKRSSQSPTILRTTTRTHTRFFTIESIELLFRDGSVREFERIASRPQPATVVIVALTEAQEVLLVREYAAGVGRYEWALPSGGIDPHESLYGAAARELMEETGYCAREFETICSLALAPSILAYQAEVVLARGLYPCSAKGDEPEKVECAAWPLDRAHELSAQAALCDARTLAALFMVREYLKSQPREPR